MQMGVSNSLAGCLASVDADVVAIWHASRFAVRPNGWKKSPDGGLFVVGESEEISLVASRNNQAMAVAYREGVGKRSGETVRGDEIAACHPITEDTIHG